ncbi:MAG: PEP-CTERM sorting domain-containing protein [Burkholderiales bacterium]|nr:PEP-CTERM sorting domain-containing protein [Burkholderiales bacterium]
MSKKLVSSLAALALVSFCGLSQAESVSFSGFAHGSQTVTATLTGPNVPVSKTVSAGGFSTIVNGGPSFESYCIDLYQTINFGAPPYTDYSFAGLGHLFTNANAYTDLGRLFATAGLVNNSVSEAAFQIAVWEIAYEATGTAYNLASGAATFAGGTAASSGALTLATTWLNSLFGSGPAITVMDSREHQDIVFAPIPEPETYALFMAGLAAVGFMAKRRRKA